MQDETYEQQLGGAERIETRKRGKSLKNRATAPRTAEG